MATTEENLKEAFAGESQANRKYLAFAKKAEKEGFSNVACLFRAAAEAETIHAMAHLNALDAVKSTADNLQAAIDGETFESTEMYPPMAAQAKAENHKAQRMFEWAIQAEDIHAQIYKKALEAVAQGKDLAEANIYVCPVCGHIELGTPTDSCPICHARKEAYIKI